MEGANDQFRHRDRSSGAGAEIARAPKLRVLRRGTPQVRFAIAVSELYTDPDTDERRERVHSFRVVGFGRVAQLAAEHLRQDSQVGIRGSLRSRESEDAEGATCAILEIRMAELLVLGSPRQESAPGATAAAPSDPRF